MIYFKFLDGVSFVNNRVFDGKSVNLLCGMGGGTVLLCYCLGERVSVPEYYV